MLERWVWIAATAALAAVSGCAGTGPPVEGPVVRLQATEEGFQPEVAVIPADRPVTLLVTRKTDQTCAREMVFASTGATHDLPLNREVRIPVQLAAGDTLHFACAMDMWKGAVVAK